MTILNQRGTAVDATNGTTWASTNLCIDGTYGTNDATYGTWTNASRSATAYINIGGFDFSSIPAGATINSVTVLIRHYESNTTYINAVTFQPYDGTTAIGSAFAATRATAARSDSTTFSPTLAQLQSAAFCVRVNATRSNQTTSTIFRLDYVDISVDYTAVQTIQASATFGGTSSFSATGTVEHVVAASASFAAASSFAATGTVEHFVTASATFSADSTFSATGDVTGGGSTRTQVQAKSATSSSPFTSISVTMSPAVTAGNVIVAALACDKNTPNIAPPGSGWNVIINNAGTSVSMWVGWKVADGGETTLTWTHDAGTDAAGDTIWVAEYSDSGSGSWTDLGSTSSPSDNSTVTVMSTGTTSATTAIGEALAFFAIDSGQSSTGASYNNSFTEIRAWASSGRGDIAVAHYSDLAASTTAECTQTHTGTADQVSAAILVLAKTTGAATVQATASFSATSEMTAVGFVTLPSSATFDAVSAFSSTGFATRLASVTCAASSAFSATGFATRPASVTYAASSGFSATSFVQRPASATFTASAGFTAVATVTSTGVLATFELWELGTFIATLGTQTINTADGNTLLSFDLQPYLASLTDNTGSGIELRVTAPSGLRIESAEWRSLYLAPQGVVTVQATATFDATSGFIATGLVTKESSATFSGTATFTAVGTRVVTPSISYTASSTFTATATPVKVATATYAATSTFTAIAIRAAESATTYSASSTFTATAIRTALVSAAYAATSTFTATGFLIAVANVTYAATSTFTALASTLGQVDAAVTYTSSSTFTATGTKTAISTALYSASSTFTAVATRITFATVSYAASSTFTAVGTTIKLATVTMTATSTFVATAFRVLPTQVTYAATSTFSATAVRAAVVAVSYTATSTFVATGLHVSVATATYSGVSTFIATGDVGIPVSTNDVWGIEF